jgi:uncharacterized protein CbrC (UPF0167 family)
VGGIFGWPQVSKEIIEEVSFRTPGFSSWQSEYWFTHFNDAAGFQGAVGYKELMALGREAVDAIRTTSGVPDEDWESYFHALDKEGSPTAYLFHCLHCGKYGGYSDCD